MKPITEQVNSAVFDELSVLSTTRSQVMRMFPLVTSLSDQTETDGTAAFPAHSPAVLTALNIPITHTHTHTSFPL